MRRRSLLLTTVLAAATAPALAQQEQRETRQAEQAAEQWLRLTDAGSYPAAWTASALLLRAIVPQAQWESAMQAVRKPLGAVKQRTLRSATFMREMPGAPDGEYVVILYDTVFEYKAKAVETITPARDKDGTWQIAGYFIQ